MLHHKLTARVEGIDEATGVFRMTLATEGEASDGHVLSIKGARVPATMPLLISHVNDPTSQAGSITDPTKKLKEKPPSLEAIGRIEMTGEGSPAEIRRDLAHMIARGHVGAVSIRWDEVLGKSVRRVNLPSDHQYYVDAATTGPDDPRYWGWFFEEWDAREGSLVAIGADPQALVKRAEETRGDVATFWRAMAEEVAAPPDETRIARALASLSRDARGAAGLGATTVDLVNAVTAEASIAEARDFEVVDLTGRRFFFPAPIAARVSELAALESLAPVVDEATGLMLYVEESRVADLRERLEVSPEVDEAEVDEEEEERELAASCPLADPPVVPVRSLSMAELGTYLAEEICKRDAAAQAEYVALIDAARGKVKS